MRAGRQRDPVPAPRGRHLLRRIEQATRQTIEPMEIPTNEVINKRRVVRFHERITAGMEHPDLETFTSLVEQYREENDVPLEQIAAALAALAAGDTPFLLTGERPARLCRSEARRITPQLHARRSFGGERRNGTGTAGASAAGAKGGLAAEWRRSASRSAMPTRSSRPTSSVRSPMKRGSKVAFIGRIEIFDEHSTVDMLAGMPAKMFEMLKHVKIGGRRLDISRLADGSGPDDWPAVASVKAAAPAPALPLESETEDRADAESRIALIRSRSLRSRSSRSS